MPSATTTCRKFVRKAAPKNLLREQKHTKNLQILFLSFWGGLVWVRGGCKTFPEWPFAPGPSPTSAETSNFMRDNGGQIYLGAWIHGHGVVFFPLSDYGYVVIYMPNWSRYRKLRYDLVRDFGGERSSWLLTSLTSGELGREREALP